MRHAQDETKKTNEAKGKPFASLRAENETRTRDLRITNASLYQLSYFGNANLSIAVQKYAFLPTLPNYPPVIFKNGEFSWLSPQKATATMPEGWSRSLVMCEQLRCLQCIYLSAFFVALAVVFFSAGFLAVVAFLAAGFLAAGFFAGFSASATGAASSAGAGASSAGTSTSAFT